MRRSAWMMCVLLAAASTACKKDEPAADPMAQLPPPDTTMAADTAMASPAAPAVTTPAPAQAPRRQAPPPPMALNRDVPYVSDDTGTIAPGMTQAQVEALWGGPVATRSTGPMTYLYYPNGCEWTCGTLDVVFLENGQVVDAVLRWPGHRYSGQSSSPPGTQPVATVPDRPTP